MNSQQLATYMYTLFVWAVTNIIAVITRQSAMPGHDITSDPTLTNWIQAVSAFLMLIVTYGIMRYSRSNSVLASRTQDLSERTRKLSQRIYELTYRPDIRIELSKPFGKAGREGRWVNATLTNGGQSPIYANDIQMNALQGEHFADVILDSKDEKASPIFSKMDFVSSFNSGPPWRTRMVADFDIRHELESRRRVGSMQLGTRAHSPEPIIERPKYRAFMRLCLPATPLSFPSSFFVS